MDGGGGEESLALPDSALVASPRDFLLGGPSPSFCGMWAPRLIGAK